MLTAIVTWFGQLALMMLRFAVLLLLLLVVAVVVGAVYVHHRRREGANGEWDQPGDFGSVGGDE